MEDCWQGRAGEDTAVATCAYPLSRLQLGALQSSALPQHQVSQVKYIHSHITRCLARRTARTSMSARGNCSASTSAPFMPTPFCYRQTATPTFLTLHTIFLKVRQLFRINREKKLLEKVQICFTCMIPGLRKLSHETQLKHLKLVECGYWMTAE